MKDNNRNMRQPDTPSTIIPREALATLLAEAEKNRISYSSIKEKIEQARAQATEEMAIVPAQFN